MNICIYSYVNKKNIVVVFKTVQWERTYPGNFSSPIHPNKMMKNSPTSKGIKKIKVSKREGSGTTES